MKIDSADAYVKTFPKIQEILKKRPALDFKGLCQTIAIKEGGSQIPHLDWMDHPAIYAFVICIGPGWKGGKLYFPQLHRAVPTSPSQVIAFQVRCLAHFTAPVERDHLALTCFVDQSTLDKALAMFPDMLMTEDL